MQGIVRIVALALLWFGLTVAPAHADIPTTAAPWAGGTLVRVASWPAKAVAPRQVAVWLPPDYATSTRRYPVIYMHDGQNLFDPHESYGGASWGIAEVLQAMHRQAIVVGIWNTPLRGREYFPASIYAALPPAQQDNANRVHGGPPLSDAYLAFITGELKPWVDATWRTDPGPKATSMMGSSMGGLISIYAMARYPEVFGQVACLSVHWPLADPRTADPAAVATAFADLFRTAKWHPGANRLYMDHGTETLDAFYRPYSEKIEPLLAANGWHRDIDWVSRVFPGGAHNEASWHARLDVPVGFLLPAP